MTFTPPPEDIFTPSTRVLWILAHQDDELPYAGLVQRMPASARFLWITNGDGLAREAGVERNAYSAARIQETQVAMHVAGVSPDRLRCLGNSEHEIYRHLALLGTDRGTHEAMDLMRSIANQVRAEVLGFRPDVVFTLAFQGGNPEHDLAHLTARAALRELPGARLFELPEYELANTVPLRFPPWRRGEGHEIRLRPEELAVKAAMSGCYPTQARIIRQFKRLMAVAGVVNPLRGRALGWDGFAGFEQFAPVPTDRDYTRAPHGFDALEYVGDDFEGEPIRFSTMIAPLARAILG